MNSLKFTLPQVPLDEDLLLADKKVAVVSLFGKSPYSAHGCKAGILDEILGRQVFQSSLLEDPDVDKDSLCDIEGYYDKNQRVIYLHLRGVFDIYALVKLYDNFSKDMEQKGYLQVWADLKYRYARALLFLFSVSHILVVYHPTHTFDISYVHLFRALDVVRQKTQATVSELLRSVSSVPKEWINNGRPCSPRVLFLFNSCPTIFKDSNRNSGISEGAKGSRLNIKKLEHALEDQIYHILRKSRVITNASSNSLFAIPANQEFVFVRTEPDQTQDRMGHMVHELIKFCQNSASTDRITEGFKNIKLDKQKNIVDHSFKSFLQQHIDIALSKGFEDNVGKHVTPSFFEATTSSVWFELAVKLFTYFLPPVTENVEKSVRQQVFSTLRSMLDTDMRFSEGRCGKVLPLATATYQENLPSHYTRDYHESRLTHALSVFALQARGPLVDDYAAQLEKECERFWKAGRQMCEVLSLTGNPCTNPLHRGGGDGAGGGELHSESSESRSLEPRDHSQLPLMEHSSGVRYVSACNCGRKQGPREDPFTVRSANFDFYKMLSEECGCNKLESFHFPVFQPSTQDYRAAQLFSSAMGSKRKDSSAKCEGKELTVSTPQGNTQGFSFVGFVSGQSGGSDIIQEEVTNRLSPHSNPPREQSPTDGHEIVIQVSDADSDNSKDKSLVRQPSTTEYLPGMLHADSPVGLLPQFPSWSLVCLGPSSLYSHNLGLQDQQQAGLLGGSAYLLPWDVTVRLEHHRDRNSCWPAVGDTYHGRGKHLNSNTHISGNLLRGRKSKTGNKDLSEFVVKIFVGVEYECPRGHRFMCSAPDKVLKTTGSGLVKDNGNKVTGSDMPLYFPCPCRAAKPLIAQLMRIHVVTPKAPVHVTLNPRVQPAPAPCPVFVTGCDQPLRLSQSAYWVLRLPYVYVGDQGPYLPPKESAPLSYGRLLTGVYGITEVSPEENISMEEAKDVHKSLRKAAGIFHFIQNQYLTQLPGGYKGGEDLDPRVLGAYSTQCTAEAQEVTVARAVELKHNPSLISALANETSRMFHDAATFLTSVEVAKQWMSYLKIKAAFYQSYAYSYCGENLLSQDKCGEAIRALQESNSCYQNALELCKIYNKTKGPAPIARPETHIFFRKLEPYLKRTLEKCQRENGFIYHQKVPADPPPLENKATYGLASPEEFAMPPVSPLWNPASYAAFDDYRNSSANDPVNSNAAAKVEGPLPPVKEAQIHQSTKDPKTESGCILQ